jgi:hypothetical protein
MKSPEEVLTELTNMEIERADKVTLNFYYKYITGADIGTCPLCRDEAVSLIKRWINKQMEEVNISSKYRFKKDYNTIEVILRVGDNRVKINSSTLTEANAQRLLHDERYCHLIEENPDYGKPEKKSEVKTESSGGSTSTLQEPTKEEEVLKKKRGRKPKSI